MNKTIIVKVGTESLTDFHTSEKVEKMVRDIARLVREKIHVILVSSGAVRCGREIIPDEKNKQVLASVGQPILMARYAKKFQKHGIITAQILPTHAALEDVESHRTQFIATVEAIMTAGILPIINENDALSTAEMRELGKGADNDFNALLVAKLVDAQDIVLLTNTNGVYRNRNKSDSRIKSLQGSAITDEWIDATCGNTSRSGTGGMQSKLRIGREFAKLGGTTHICNGLDSGVWDHLMKAKTKGGTRIVP